jgi:hypothetical protein
MNRFLDNIIKGLVIAFGIVFALMVGMLKPRHLFGTPFRNLKYKIKEKIKLWKKRISCS